MTAYQKMVGGLAAAAVTAFGAVLLWPATAPIVKSQLLFLRTAREARWAATQALIEAGFGRPRTQPPEIRRVLAAHPDDLQIQLAVATRPAQLREVVKKFPQSPAACAALLTSEVGSEVAIRRPDEDAFELTLEDTGAAAPGTSVRPPSSPQAGAYPGMPSWTPSGGDAASGSGAPPPVAGLPGTTPAPIHPVDYDTAPSPANLAAFDREAAAAEKLDPSNAFFPMMRAIGFYAGRQDERAEEQLFRAGRADRWENYDSEAPLGTLKIMDQAFGDQTAVEKLVVENELGMHVLGQYRELARMARFKAVLAERAGRVSEAISLRHALIRLGTLMTASSGVILNSLVGQAISAIGADDRGATFAVARTQGVNGHAYGMAYEQYLRRTGHPAEAAWVSSQMAFGRTTRQIIRRAVDNSLDDPGSALSGVSELLLLWEAGMAILANILVMLAAGGVAALLLRRSERVRPLPFLLVPAALAAGLVVLWFGLGAGAPDWGDIWAPALCGLAAPGLVTLVSGIRSLLHKTPLLTGLTRGLKAAAVPCAGVLLLAYSVLAPFTAAVDRRESAAAVQRVRNEAGFETGLVHESWPPPMPR